MQVPESTGFQAPIAPMQNMAPQQQAMPGQQAASYYPNMGNVFYSFKRACNNFWKKKNDVHYEKRANIDSTTPKRYVYAWYDWFNYILW